MKIKFEREVRISIDQLKELDDFLENAIVFKHYTNQKYDGVYEGKYGNYYFRYNPTRWKLITILDVENV